MYRWAECEDKPTIMALWSEAFESYEPYYSWYFNTVFQPKLTLCDFRGTTLAAMLQIAPYTLSLRGAALKAAYLVGVITAPAFRGQGLAMALVEEAHIWLAQHGYVAALLYTDIPGFYEPLGYRHCYKRQLLDLPTAQFILFDKANSNQSDWREGSLSEDIPTLSAIYKSMTAHYEGYIQRNQENWRVYLGEHNCDNARLTLAKNRAYVLYKMDKETLQVIELGFVDKLALEEALEKTTHLGVSTGAKSINWPAPLNAPQLLPQISADFWQPQPFVMARMLSKQSVAEALGCSLKLRRLLEWLQMEMLTHLIFGVEYTPNSCPELSPKEKQLLAEIFPPLPLWINEYT